MKVLYISSSPSENEYNNIQSKVNKNHANENYGMPEASYKFHKLIIEGLIENDAQIYSLVGRSVSKKTHHGLIWRSKKEKNKKVKYNHVFFINLPIIKHLFICFQMFFLGLFWLIKNRKQDDKMIILDGAYITLLPIVNLMTFFIKANKISIICDVYSYMADVNDARTKKNKIHKVLSKIIKKQYQKMNGFIFLTEEMSELPPFKNKPYTVIEGLVDTTLQTKTKSENYIMYAGALRAEYGVKRLVEAFHKTNNENMELLLFGNGSYVEEIEKLSKIDKRIKYKGKKSLEEIYEYEKNALLLVNPRLTEAEFAKYSFPSKNMEYMLSGTPLLTGKLPGMPKDYYEYVYLIEDDSEKALENSLTEIFKKSKQELKEFGKKAQKFISNFKNKTIQTKKIIDLNKRIMSEKKAVVKPIFKFEGINKYLPIILGGGFFLLTILLFIFGPFDWHVINSKQVYTFLVVAFLLLVAGYILAIKASRVYVSKKYIDINKVVLICIIMFFIIYIPTVYCRTGKWYPDIINGIFNSGSAYAMAHASNGSVIEYIRIIFSPFLIMITPLYILFFKKLNMTNKILGGITIILTLFLGIACGVTKQFADFLIQVFIFSGLLFFSNDNAKGWKNKFLVIIALLCCCLLFLLYYKTIMTNRVSTDIESNPIVENNNLTENKQENINSTPNKTEVENTMKEYSTFGFATIKENYPIINKIPDNLKTPVLYLVSYITHGYNGLSFAMTKDFTSSYGLGFSEFFRHNVSKFFGTEFEEDIYSRTYMYKIEENSWKTLDVWSSFFIYPASDIGFLFTLVLVLFIGYAFGYAWKDALLTGNIYASVSFYNLIILIFYFSANNQLFQTGEAFVSSCYIFIVYIIQILSRRKAQIK